LSNILALHQKLGFNSALKEEEGTTMSPKPKSAGQKAAQTRKRRAAAKKAATTRKRRAAGQKAARTRSRKAAAKKAAATRKQKVQAPPAKPPASEAMPPSELPPGTESSGK
jgi:hypothetical protein